MQHTWDEMNMHPFLGVVASLLDTIASKYVFGPMYTIGRPRGYLTLDTICELDEYKVLSTVQHNRWLQFVQVWRTAGWSRADLVLLTKEMRPLQYGHPQSQAPTAKVGAEQMLKCSSSYGNSQGHRRFKLKESLIRFLNVVQQNFLSPSWRWNPHLQTTNGMPIRHLSAAKKPCEQLLARCSHCQHWE